MAVSHGSIMIKACLDEAHVGGSPLLCEALHSTTPLFGTPCIVCTAAACQRTSAACWCTAAGLHCGMQQASAAIVNYKSTQRTCWVTHLA